MEEIKIEPIFPGTYIFPTSPHLAAMFDDPRLEGIMNQTEKERAAYVSAEERFLQPNRPPEPTKSRYVLMQDELVSARLVSSPVDLFQFVEQPSGYNDCSRWGGGLGFNFIRGRHAVRAKLRKKAKGPYLWLWGQHCLLASPDALTLLEEFGIDQLDVLEINFTDDSDPSLADYTLVDVLRNIDAYDYERCECIFRKIDGRMFGRLGKKRWFREDEIDPSIHFFHDYYDRGHFVMSRALWKYLLGKRVRGFSVIDPATFNDAKAEETHAALRVEEKP